MLYFPKLNTNIFTENETNFSRVKFYGGWIIAEAICIACNLGTVEKDDGSVDYSSILNIDIYNVSYWHWNIDIYNVSYWQF